MALNLSFDDFKPLISALENAGLPILSTLIQAMVSMIPGGGLFAPFVGAALNSLFPLINTKLGLDPETPPDQTAAKIMDDPNDAQSKLAAVQEEHGWLLDTMKEEDTTALASQQQQVSLDTAELQNPSMFVAGWRPAMGWGFGALVLMGFSMPYLIWFFQNIGIHVTDAPKPDPLSVEILMALLGLISLTRSYDKVKGTAPNAIGGTTKVLTKSVSTRSR